jgi:ATP synthase protein I
MNEGKGATPHALSFCRKENASLAKFDNPWQAIGLVSLIGVDMAVCVVAGVWLGKYIDRLLATNPWFMMLGLLAGLAIGVYSVYRLIRSYL